MFLLRWILAAWVFAKLLPALAIGALMAVVAVDLFWEALVHMTTSSG